MNEKSTPTRTGSVSLVIPCCNEQAVLETFYERAAAIAEKLAPRQVEFVFVNDGSADGTAETLDKLAGRDPRVRVIHLAQNRGQQIALTAGMDFASGDAVVTLDADLQDPPEAIPALLAKIDEGYDIVHAQRGRRPGETLFKLLSAWLFYRMMRLLTGGQIVENCGDFRAFTRRALIAISKFREPHRFLRGMFAQLGFRQCAIPYDRAPRWAGKSKWTVLRMVRLAADAVLSFSAFPIRLVIGIAIALWALSIPYLLRALYARLVVHHAVHGWASIIALMTFFTGVILGCLAILAAYIARIFEQGKNRPLYWIASTRNIDAEGDSRLFRPGHLDAQQNNPAK